jgi:RNA polymerase sigma-70 factor, ECF subfamily
MNREPDCIDELIRRAVRGDEEALGELFSCHRDRLRHMIRLRLDRRLQGRVDPSDVLQDAYIDMAEKLPEYAGRAAIPFFVWLRLVVGERLLRVHRHHLGAEKRDATREISLNRGAFPEASSASLADQLLGQISSASRAAVRAEMKGILEEVLSAMEPIDREVIALRHFEELRNDEVAAVLGLTKAAASKRYVRAMLRLKAAMADLPGLVDTSGARGPG